MAAAEPVLVTSSSGEETDIDAEPWRAHFLAPVSFSRGEGDATLLHRLTGEKMRLPVSAAGGYNLVWGDGLVIQHADGSLYDRVDNIFWAKVETGPDTKQVVQVIDGRREKLPPEKFRIASQYSPLVLDEKRFRLKLYVCP